MAAKSAAPAARCRAMTAVPPKTTAAATDQISSKKAIAQSVADPRS
jgi:hypothetical protein